MFNNSQVAVQHLDKPNPAHLNEQDDSTGLFIMDKPFHNNHHVIAAILLVFADIPFHYGYNVPLKKADNSSITIDFKVYSSAGVIFLRLPDSPSTSFTIAQALFIQDKSKTLVQTIDCCTPPDAFYERMVDFITAIEPQAQILSWADVQSKTKQYVDCIYNVLKEHA